MLHSRAGVVDLVEVGAVQVVYLFGDGALLVEERGAAGVVAKRRGVQAFAVRAVERYLAQPELVGGDQAHMARAAGREALLRAVHPLEDLRIALLERAGVRPVLAVHGELHRVLARVQAAEIAYLRYLRLLGEGDVHIAAALGELAEALRGGHVPQAREGHGGVHERDGEGEQGVPPRDAPLRLREAEPGAAARRGLLPGALLRLGRGFRRVLKGVGEDGRPAPGHVYHAEGGGDGENIGEIGQGEALPLYLSADIIHRFPPLVHWKGYFGRCGRLAAPCARQGCRRAAKSCDGRAGLFVLPRRREICA